MLLKNSCNSWKWFLTSVLDSSSIKSINPRLWLLYQKTTISVNYGTLSFENNCFFILNASSSHLIFIIFLALKSILLFCVVSLLFILNIYPLQTAHLIVYLLLWVRKQCSEEMKKLIQRKIRPKDHFLTPMKWCSLTICDFEV